MPKTNVSLRSLFDSGAMGEHGAPGSPGKNLNFTHFNKFLIICTDWQSCFNLVVCLQVLLVHRASQVTLEPQEQKANIRLYFAFIFIAHTGVHNINISNTTFFCPYDR